MKRLFISIIICLFTIVGILFPNMDAYANEHNFSDVSAQYIFSEEVVFLYGKNIIAGFADGTFRPDAIVTRAQAAVMIGRAMNLDGTPRTTNFRDVNADVTGSGYIASAVEKGIISGFKDGTFRPYEPVTRGQMASF